MAGLVPPARPKPLRRGEGPAIHVFDPARRGDVDARDKRGHDDGSLVGPLRSRVALINCRGATSRWRRRRRRCGSRRRVLSRSAPDACRRCAGSTPGIWAMSRLVLPLLSQDSTSDSRLVRPELLAQIPGRSRCRMSRDSRSRNSSGPSLPMYCSRRSALRSGDDFSAAFGWVRPSCSSSSHSSQGGGNSSRRAGFGAIVGGEQLLRLRRRPDHLADAVDREQIAARDVERGARALAQPRVGEVDLDPRRSSPRSRSAW